MRKPVYFAYKISADIGGFSVDASSDSAEKSHRRSTEAEARNTLRNRCKIEQAKYDTQPYKPESRYAKSHYRAASESDLECFRHTVILCSGSGSDVALRGNAHSKKACKH